MNFKLIFPAPYHLNVEDILNSNLDINIVLENTFVYWGTIYTLENIRELMISNKEPFFWSSNFLIIEDMSLETIKITIEKIISKGDLDNIFVKIGDINTIYGLGNN